MEGVLVEKQAKPGVASEDAGSIRIGRPCL
jgi:hypothetical protein